MQFLPQSYNATDTFVANLLNPTADDLSNLTQYINLQPTSPGMYNLPVCVLRDLGAVPHSIQGPWPESQIPGWPSQTQPCSCVSDEANIKINGTTYYFRDFATNATVTEFDKLIKDAYGSDTTCYVAPKGQPDCVDIPDQSGCETPYGPLL